MIRSILATTALSTLVVTGVYAQTPAPAEQSVQNQESGQNVTETDRHLASNIMGQDVYTGVGEDAETIGSVNDILIAENGMTEAIVIGVGGFLGVGAKDVAVEYQRVEWAAAGQDGEPRMVLNATRESLENLEEFDAAAYQSNDETGPSTSPETGQNLGAAPADDPEQMQAERNQANGEATTADEMLTSSIDRRGMEEVNANEISADQLIGTEVLGANDEDVGEIGDVIVTRDGQVDAVVVDVGGFLGIGAKPVAIGLQRLSFLKDQGGQFYLQTNFTRETLEAHPTYNESTFPDDRESQLLTDRGR